MTGPTAPEGALPQHAEVTRQIDPRVDFLRHHESPFLRLYSYFLDPPQKVADVPDLPHLFNFSYAYIFPNELSIFFADPWGYKILRQTKEHEQIKPSQTETEVTTMLKDRFEGQRQRFLRFVEDLAGKDPDFVALRALLQEFIEISKTKSKSTKPLTAQEEETRVRNRFDKQSGGERTNGEYHQNESLRGLMRRIRGRVQVEENEQMKDQDLETWLRKADSTYNTISENMLREMLDLGVMIPSVSGENEIEEDPWDEDDDPREELPRSVSLKTYNDRTNITRSDLPSLQVLPPEKGKGRKIRVGDRVVYPIFNYSSLKNSIEESGLFWDNMTDWPKYNSETIDPRFRHITETPEGMNRVVSFYLKGALFDSLRYVLEYRRVLLNPNRLTEFQEEVSSDLGLLYARTQSSALPIDGWTRRTGLIALMGWEALMDGKGVTWDIFQRFIARPIMGEGRRGRGEKDAMINQILETFKTPYAIGGKTAEIDSRLTSKKEAAISRNSPAFVVRENGGDVLQIDSISSGEGSPEKVYKPYRSNSRLNVIRERLAVLAGEGEVASEDLFSIDSLRPIAINEGYGYLFLPQFATLRDIVIRDEHGSILLNNVAYRIEYDSIHGYYRVAMIGQDRGSIHYAASFDVEKSQKPQTIEAIGLDKKSLGGIISQFKELGLSGIATELDKLPSPVTTADLLHILSDRLVYSYDDDPGVEGFEKVDNDISHFLPGIDSKTGKLAVQCRHIAKLIQHIVTKASTLSDSALVYTPNLFTASALEQTAPHGFSIFDTGHTEVRYERQGRKGVEQWKVDLTPPSEAPTEVTHQIIAAISPQLLPDIEMQMTPPSELANRLKRNLLLPDQQQFKNGGFERTVGEPLHLSDELLRQLIFRQNSKDNEKTRVIHILDFLQRKGESFFADNEVLQKTRETLSGIVASNLQQSYHPFQEDKFSFSNSGLSPGERVRLRDHHTEIVRAASVARQLLEYIEGHHSLK